MQDVGLAAAGAGAGTPAERLQRAAEVGGGCFWTCCPCVALLSLRTHVFVSFRTLCGVYPTDCGSDDFATLSVCFPA